MCTKSRVWPAWPVYLAESVLRSQLARALHTREGQGKDSAGAAGESSRVGVEAAARTVGGLVTFRRTE